MAFFAQILEQQTDRRWRRDWRVVVFRLERNPDNGRLWWQRQHHTSWYGPFRGRGRAYRPMDAKQNAQRHGVDKRYPVFTAVRHNGYITPTQSAQIAFRAGMRTPDGKRPPGWAALDWLMENEREIPITVNVGLVSERITEMAERDAMDAARAASEN